MIRVFAPTARLLGSGLVVVGLLAVAVALCEVAFVGRMAGLRDLEAAISLDPRALALMTLMVLRAAFAQAATALHLRFANAVAGRLRLHFARRLLGASPYAPLPVGRDVLPEELQNDAHAAAALPFELCAALVREPIRIIGFGAVLAAAGLPLALVVAAATLACGLALRALSGALARAIERHHERSIRVNATLRDGLDHQATWLASGQMGRVGGRIAEQIAHADRAGRRSAAMQATLQLVMRLAYYGAVIAGVWAANRFAGRPLQGFGAIASLGVAAAWLQGPIGSVAALRNAWLQARPSFARLLALEELVPLDPPPERERTLEALARGISVEDVALSYAGGRTALAGIDFEWPAGTCLGVTGPSGSGKTTLGRVLARLVAPDRGTVRLDGVNLADLTAVSLRRLVGVVLQPPELVRGTLRENLTLGRLEASPAEIAAVLSALRLDGFVAGLAEGLDTPLGDAAEQVSSGQRLRIALARVLLAAPAIAILDEPTTSLDDESAAAVIAALAEFARGRSLCLISHDPRVLALCDQLIALRDGKVDPRAAPTAPERASAPGAETTWRRSGAGGRP